VIHSFVPVHLADFHHMTMIDNRVDVVMVMIRDSRPTSIRPIERRMKTTIAR
jgi:hypothetical protein